MKDFFYLFGPENNFVQALLLNKVFREGNLLILTLATRSHRQAENVKTIDTKKGYAYFLFAGGAKLLITVQIIFKIHYRLSTA